MKTKRLLICLMTAILCCGLASAQADKDGIPPREDKRPTAYELTKDVKTDLGLTDKEFNKVYSAYEKYLKTIFGDDAAKQSQGPRPGGHGGGFGGPGGGQRGHGGQGAPGGMPPQRGGFGDGKGDFDRGQAPHKAPSKEMTENMEKFEKNVKKADEKLSKSIKKLFKKTPEKYDRWLKIKEHQQARILPKKPIRQEN